MGDVQQVTRCAVMGGPLHEHRHTEVVTAWAYRCGWSGVRPEQEGYKTFNILDIKPS